MEEGRVGEMVELDSVNGSLLTYVAGSDGDRPGVVVLQEFWGMVPQIKGVADRLAGEGFIVSVPDLYDGATTDDRDTATDLMMGLDPEKAALSLRAVVDDLELRTGRRGVGCVGFCMGGGLALVLATTDARVRAAVVYYGRIPWESVEPAWHESQAEFQLHYASDDDWATPALAAEVCDALRHAGKGAELHLYDDAGHAFLDETRPESHHFEATELSWERTVRFLRRVLNNKLTPTMEA